MWDLVDRLKVGESGHAYVVDRKGLLIAFGDTGRVLRGEKLSHLKNVSEFMSNPFKKDKTGVKLSIGINGNMVMGTYVSLETPDWAVMTELPVKEAYRRVIHTAMIFAGILLVMAVLTGLMGVWVARRLAVPILNLTKTASRIAGGELGLKAMMEGPTEVTRLAGAFNHMTEQLCAMLDTEEERTRKLTQEVEHRKKAEESLKESSSILTANVEELRQLRNYLSNIINSMPSALVGVDTEERVTQWNRAVEESTGIVADVARGKKLSELIPWLVPETQTIAESIRTRQVRQEQKRPRQKKEEICYEDITIYPLIANGVDGAVIRIDDVTEKVRLEAMMIQSEKMLSVGGLAAGMAHEINNPLAGMVQTATVMAERLTNMSLPANHKAAEAAGTTMKAIENFMKARSIPRMIHAINESGRRVATIVDNMLSFARKSEATASSHTMESLIDKTIELAATDYDLKKHYDFKLIQVVKEYTDNLPLVPCEGAKIQQVLLNIFHNGAQAMQTAGTKNPMFVIRTRFDAKQHMVVMEIEDNGPGMNETVRKRVFEPFFTTKPVGVGTGLGLSVSYFIITENHGGIMTVESSPGAGAKFIIQLPVDRKT
jgi:PAS domain S-box-containing protein